MTNKIDLDLPDVTEATDAARAMIKAPLIGSRTQQDIDAANAIARLGAVVVAGAKVRHLRQLAAPQLARIIEDVKPRRETASSEEWNGAPPAKPKPRLARRKAD